MFYSFDIEKKLYFCKLLKNRGVKSLDDNIGNICKSQL